MEDNPFSGMSKYQFGFREGVSTIDALETVIALIERRTFKGDFCIGVSLDVKNAFNSLPWRFAGHWIAWDSRSTCVRSLTVIYVRVL